MSNNTSSSSSKKKHKDKKKQTSNANSTKNNNSHPSSTNASKTFLQTKDVKQAAENQKAFKRLRDDVLDEVLPRRTVTSSDIYESKVPEDEHIRGYWQLQVWEILSFFVKSGKKVEKSLMGLYQRLLEDRIRYKDEIVYPRTIAGGKASNNTVSFILECNALLIENHRVPFEIDHTHWRLRGFKIDKNLRWCTQREINYNMLLLSKWWYKMNTNSKEIHRFLIWLQCHVAHLVCIRETGSQHYLNGDIGKDCTLLLPETPSPAAQSQQQQQPQNLPTLARSWTAHMTWVNGMACNFLGFYESLFQLLEVYKEFNVLEWTPEVFQDDAKSWPLNGEVPPEFFDWITNETELTADSVFKEKITHWAMAMEITPGEELNYLYRNRNIPTTSIVKIISDIRPAIARDWWLRDALEPDMKIDVKHLKYTGRDTLWTALIIGIFDSLLKSKFKFPWKQAVFYTEKRFNSCYIDCIGSGNPLIVRLMGKFFVFYNNRFVKTVTIDKAIFFWTFLMKQYLDFNFKYQERVYDLQDLNMIWLQWTTVANLRKDHTEQNEKSSDEDDDDDMEEDEEEQEDVFDQFDSLQQQQQNRSRIIINENSVLTDYQME